MKSIDLVDVAYGAAAIELEAKKKELKMYIELMEVYLEELKKFIEEADI